ncbi:acyl-CoA synthetase [Zavarzinia sp. CC-PAN008]|uniref:acyl-CoA synthetase n=1 Tax=Zavarzinia sp. CC-PAN008 TaxID=3243332 RepID=UPI003F74A453
MMITRAETYDEVYRSFTWDVPARINIATQVCDRHAEVEPERVCLIFDRDPVVTRHTYGELRSAANRLANHLARLGLSRGDRLAIVSPQDLAVPVSHIAAWKGGMVSCAMATLFGVDALEYRFQVSEARVVVTDRANLDKVRAAAAKAPSVAHIFLIDGAEPGAPNLWESIAGESDQFETADTAADEPAYLNFTSGTTGQPKAAVAGHRAVLGHIPSMEIDFDFPTRDDVIWSPADWAWVAGQNNYLMHGLFQGIPIVSRPRAGFDATDAFRVLSQHGVTCSLLVPTMLKLMRQVPAEVRAQYPLKLRVVMSGGEAVGAELYKWVAEVMQATMVEAFGQTECNLMLVNHTRLMPGKAGALGKACPGFVCAIVDDQGNELPPGTLGQIAAKGPHPIMLLEYLKNPEATRKKFAGPWLLTGDLGRMDEEGYFWFEGRADDIITSSGYRIGPGEIEQALCMHPSVAMAAVVGLPDPVRTEIVAAFVQLAPGAVGSDALATEIQDFVRTRLARHEVPRRIDFVDSMPMTNSGKIIRREFRERELAKQKGNAAE